MKKTLIALMAMAGAAMAAEETVTGLTAEFTTAPTWAGNCYSGDYTFTFTLTEVYTMEDFGTVLGYYRGNAINDTYGYNAIVLGGTNEALTLTIGRGKATAAVDGNGITADTGFDFQDNKTFTTTIQKGVTYTLTVTGDAGMMTPTLTWGDNGTETVAAYKSNMNGNADLTAVVNPGTITIQVPDEPVTPTIPEPTTATLSLLALAGLAARRRRR